MGLSPPPAPICSKGVERPLRGGVVPGRMCSQGPAGRGWGYWKALPVKD